MTTTPLEQQLEKAQRLLQSYLDLETDQDEDMAYVARGNGFCDRKYSDEFISLQVAQITARIADLNKQIEEERGLINVNNS